MSWMMKTSSLGHDCLTIIKTELFGDVAVKLTEAMKCCFFVKKITRIFGVMVSLLPINGISLYLYYIRVLSLICQMLFGDSTFCMLPWVLIIEQTSCLLALGSVLPTHITFSLDARPFLRSLITNGVMI